MGLTDWVGRTGRQIGADGLASVGESAYELYAGGWRTLGWHVPRGTNVYEREWDLLVLLDACRVDLLAEVAPAYEFVDGVGAVTSVGSMSEEWMAKTFVEEYADEVADTAYVTANVFSGSVLSASAFETLAEVWRYAWDDDLGTVPPRPVTDRAIHVAREESPGRLIVHYMQPHHPFVAGEGGPTTDHGGDAADHDRGGDAADHDHGNDADGSDADAGDAGPGADPDGTGFGADPFGRRDVETVVDALRNGDLAREAFWRRYRANLEYVLADVSLLLSNVDAERAVISADHGDALGEWGIYDHPAGFLHPAVTEVPWVETTASDGGEYSPEVDRSTDDGGAPGDLLRSLGYR